MYRVIKMVDTNRNDKVEYLATDKSDKYFSNRYVITEIARNIDRELAYEIESVCNRRLDTKQPINTTLNAEAKEFDWS